MNTFTFYHSPFTLLLPFTFHIEAKGKRLMAKAWKKEKGEMLNVHGGVL